LNAVVLILTLFLALPSNSSKDFRYFDWGASKAEVKKIEGTPFSENGESLLYIKKVPVNWDRDCVVKYEFVDGKLVTGLYMFIFDRYIDANSYISDFNKLKEILTSKYGKPKKDSIIVRSSFDRSLVLRSPGLFLEAGAIAYMAEWTTTKTRVRLVLTLLDTGRESTVANTVLYESIKYKALIEKANKENLKKGAKLF